MTYPLKFRRNLIEIQKREGLTIAAVAVRFGVGVAFVVRWLKTWPITPMRITTSGPQVYSGSILC